MFFGELLVEAEEVAEAPPHGECLVAEHGQRGLKHSLYDHLHIFYVPSFISKDLGVSPAICWPALPLLANIGWVTIVTSSSSESWMTTSHYLCCYFVGHVSIHPITWKRQMVDWGSSHENWFDLLQWSKWMQVYHETERGEKKKMSLTDFFRVFDRDWDVKLVLQLILLFLQLRQV